MNIQSVEWLNQNAGRAYPFQENMTRLPVDAAGRLMSTMPLPNYVIVDMIFTMPGSGDLRMYLAQLAFVGNILTFVFRESATGQIVSSVTVDLATHTSNAAYSMAGTGEWLDARGWLTIGDLHRMPSDLPEGLYNYAPAQALLEARVVRPALRGIRSLRIANNGNTSEQLFGHVKLLAGDNVRLAYDAELNGIWINAEPDAGYREACDCESPAQTNLVNTVNGIPMQDLTIVGDDECVDVKLEGSKIIISDKCSEPCCGCPELDFLNETVKVLDASITRLEEYSEKLAERITTFVTNFVMTISS